MKRLIGVVRSYAWGSRTVLAQMTGRPSPSDHPEAELWLGAHPADSAQLFDAGRTTSLLDEISADPHRQLGENHAKIFRNRLPFLLKILAAEQPLSLQAHPSAAKAREGFERENAAGIALDSPLRNYRDDSHKPELVVALSRFEALAGFRDARRTAELLKALDVAGLDPHAEKLAAHPTSSGLRTLFTQWTSVGPPDRTLIAGVLDGCTRYLSAQLHGMAGEFTAEAQTALDLGRQYPGDPGVLVSLLLNRVRLEPGEGLYLAAGNLHAYLRGTAVEIMANSDNVLRVGLTSKHVDMPELLRVLDFAPLDVTVLRPAVNGLDGTFVYPTPASEFLLTRVELDTTVSGGPNAITLKTDGPHIILCTAGAVMASSGLEKVELSQGQAVWISASDPPITVRTENAQAQFFVAKIGPNAGGVPRRGLSGTEPPVY